MAVENPPLNRIYVLGYSANDRDFPIVSLNADPRVAGYKVPEDLSTCPDKRYPNHVFTGSQPLSGDERVRHVWEILPSPTVPFTRYDDDLGPVQGRRRSVKNEGQIASLTADKRVTYEAREGSAIVYTELEESWSVATDEDGNSLFPFKDRDFYDASRGPVQERRQLFTPTGEEEGSLENVNGVITQTSYEPYNEFLSIKVVQTHKVDGPQLIGRATDNDGQLITVTTQRKGADNYIPPNPTATRTVEVNREDAESLVERIVDTPEVFKANTFSVERPDPIPQKFRVAVPIQSSQEIVEGDAEVPILEEGEISKSEEQRNKFIKRVSSTSRDQAVLPQTLTGKSTNNERQEVLVTETLQLGNTIETPTATKTVESEALGDGNYVITKTEVDEVFTGENYQKTKADLTPQKFRASQEDTVTELNIEGQANPSIVLAEGEFAKSEQQINKFVKRVSITSRVISEATTLLESVLTPEGLLATRTLTLASGAQSFTPSATLVEANVEALGDGRTVKTETTIPNIFGARAVSVERQDPIPVKFRALVPSKTDQLNVVGTVNPSISLTAGEVAKSETQQTQFVKRLASTTRDQTVLPQSLTQRETSEDRQVVTVTETLQANDTVETPTATKTIESEAIGDGNYVVRKTEVPEVFSAKTFSKERPDPVPQKFRVVVPSLTEQENLAGVAQEPNLTTGEISKSEQQVNQFVKRISTTSRDETNLPESLTQKTTTNEGLLATVSETLQSGDTGVIPTATRSVQSEALGDGTYVVTVTDLPKVFAGETFSVERPDPLPQKFRVAARTLTSQQTLIGSADPNVSLLPNDLSKSEQQVTEFVKRTSVTSRDGTTLPITLVQRSVDNDRQNVVVTETLQSSNPVTPNSATVTVQSEALGDGNFLVTTSEIPVVFSAEIYRKTKEDLTPQKFRAAQENITLEETVAGQADPNISLAAGEFAKSEQQVNKFVKRVATTSRAITAATPPLIESVLTNEGQVATRTLTLASGAQSFTPSATLVDANVEALGDGRTVKTEVVVPVVFSGGSIVKAKVDLTPQKFRAAQEDITFEESVVGTIDPNIALGAGEFRKSEQQVTEFIKRTSITQRDITASDDLEEIVITPQGQVATRILRLSSVAQSIQPDALLVDGSIEALGDGRTIKTEVRVGEVFNSLTKSAQKPDTIPEKFRVNSPIKRTEETVEQNDAEDPDLGQNEYLKTEQRLTEFTVQKTTVERDDIFNEINGQRLEENWGIQIPYREYISETIPSGDNYEAEGLDDNNHLVREYNKDDIDSTLSEFSVVIPTSLDLDLPRILQDITVDWQELKSSSSNQNENPPLQGQFTNLTQQDGGKLESTLSLSPSVNVIFEDIWGKNLPAEIHLFFLRKEQLNTGQIASKAGASSGSWPIFKPRSFSTTIFGKTESKTIEVAVSRALQTNDTPSEYGYIPAKASNDFSSAQLNPTSINIPSCLCAGIEVNSPITLTNDNLEILLEYQTVYLVTSSGQQTLEGVSIERQLEHTLECEVQFSIPQTTPADIPRSGKYLISSSAEPYKFGWFLVRAVTFNAGALS